MMTRKVRLLMILMMIAMIFVLPTSALANKKVFRASLSGSTGGRGSSVVATNIDGSIHITLRAINLSSPVTAAHIHSSVDGSILVTICNSASPTAGVPLCTPAPEGGNSVQVEANVTPQMLHVSGGQLRQALDDELTYVNVHTSLYPGGEVSGTLILR